MIFLLFTFFVIDFRFVVVVVVAAAAEAEANDDAIAVDAAVDEPKKEDEL